MGKTLTSGTRPITLQDVASKAGVGLSTASYVLNNKPKSIGIETRERVWKAAREMGYRPNMAARSLVTRQTNIVALWVPNVASAFSARVIVEIQKQARTHGYEVMICDTDRSSAKANTGNSDGHTAPVLEMPLWNVDGIIAFFSSSSRGIEHDLENNATVPTVSIGAYSIQGTDYVELSLLDASKEAMKWMLTGERRRVGYLVPMSADYEEDERHKAYMIAMNEAGQTPFFIYMRENTRASAYEATRDYLAKNEPFDALFCYNDYAAIGASRALREVGLTIPDQVLLVGCDGLEDSDYLNWPLHTIELPIPEMCATAWEFLQNRLQTATLKPQKKSYAGRFKIRGS